ncbi:MBL fold metallo-hydrolase [Roseiarcaceae bacterium H3SJ34-1]|uniref:MBL fold metallo-hydrolase n=1 Tax=Terripilifer ovatus TaxID=3032367 RepID=UPI003AB9A550|nr:MBL fold metallo-hydrolase [Roseiarcaceae bacterium H3SJ34-1]
MEIGSATIETIIDVDPFALSMDLLFPGNSIADLAPHAAVLAPHHVDFEAGHILLAIQSHLVRINGRNILIDTCVGEHKPRPRRQDWDQRSHSEYLQRLAAHGLRPEDIDVVLCTHLHADHVGWNTRLFNGRWVPTFPNARYLIGRREFDHWSDAEQREPSHHNHGSFADSVAPVADAGLVDLVEDGFELFDGAVLRLLPGHTPGQMGLCLCHGAQKAFMCADAVHSIVQVFRPDWTTRFCTDVSTAVATRLSLFEESIEAGTIIVPAHLRHFSGMRIKRAGREFAPELLE